MSAILSALFSWVMPFVTDGKSKNPSSKRLMFVASGFTFLGMCIGLTFSVFQDPKEASATLNLLILTTAGMATGGYLGGKAIDNKQASNESK